MSEEIILKAYKKRARALQRRISIEHDVNKKLKNLLTQCNEVLPDGLLRELVEHELKMLKYKYY